MVKFDTVLNRINGFGRYQKIRFILICISGLLPGIIVYLHSFIAANPKRRCKHPYDINDEYSIDSSVYYNSSIILKECEYTIDGKTNRCDSWVFDRTYYKTTLTEDWSMVCDKALWRQNVQTIYFSGLLIGSFVLGVLSDRFGRRPVMLACFILIVLGDFGIAFGLQKSFGVTNSYIIYAICRFFLAVGTRGINVTGYILGLELVTSEKRTFTGMVFQYFFPSGQLVLVVLAYLVRDWKTLALVAAIPSIPFLSYFFFLQESPRWLMSKKRDKEAYAILKNAATVNKREFDDDLWNNFLAAEAEAEQEESRTESIIHVFKSFSLSIITITLFFNWIVNNFMFYGVGLKSNDLGLNPYLTFAISATVELISIILTHFVLGIFGRKKPYGICLFISGVACFSIIFVKNAIGVVVLAMVGKFFVSSSYATIYLYSSEIFPTSVRNSCLGSCSMMARVGAMTAPLINGLGEKYWGSLPFFVFGLAGMVAGISTLSLPETHNCPLPKTVYEAETMYGFKCFRKNRVDNQNLEEIKQNVHKF